MQFDHNHLIRFIPSFSSHIHIGNTIDVVTKHRQHKQKFKNYHPPQK